MTALRRAQKPPAGAGRRVMKLPKLVVHNIVLIVLLRYAFITTKSHPQVVDGGPTLYFAIL